MRLFSKKTQKTQKTKIITHNGNFHADDIFAVATIALILDGDNKKYEIIRTRDEEIINGSDPAYAKASADKYVVDVGGEYDPNRNRFDHHQVNGVGRRENGIPYAAFGLVWKKFGPELSFSKTVAERIDAKLAQPIDALDNGVSITKNLFKHGKGDVCLYDIGKIFKAFMPTWKERGLSTDPIFQELVNIAKKILEREITVAEHKEEARGFVIDAYNKADDKRLIIFDKHYSWSNTIKDFNEPLFVVMPRTDKNWNILAIRKEEGDFTNKKDLPESWAGLRDEELAKATGIKDAIFCHIKRFIAVAKSKEGAVSLAKQALQD